MAIKTSLNLNALKGDLRNFYVRHGSQPETVEPKEITGIIKHIHPDARMVYISNPYDRWPNGETVYVQHIVEIGFPSMGHKKLRIDKYVPNLVNPSEGSLEGEFI